MASYRLPPEIQLYQLDELLEALEREAAEVHPVKRRAYLKKAHAVFEQWKQEHGERTPPHAGKRELASRPWLSFDQALPYQTGGIYVFNSIDLCWKLWLERYGPLQLLIDNIGIEKLLAVLALDDQTPDGRSDSVIRVVCLNLQYKGIHLKAISEHRKSILPDYAAHRLRLRALERGRPKGSAQNKQRAAEYHHMWKRISKDLFREHPTWTLREHVDYIQKHAAGQMKNGRPYSTATIKNVIKGGRKEWLETSKAPGKS